MPFIEERLQSLNEIDQQIVALTAGMSRVFETFTSKQSTSNDAEVRGQIADETKEIYELISNIAISLRKEVKIVDENTGAHDKNNDGVMILPIAVDQKNSTLGEKKLTHEMEQLSKLIETEQVVAALKDKDEQKDKKLESIAVNNDKESNEEVEAKDINVNIDDDIEKQTQEETQPTQLTSTEQSTELGQGPVKLENDFAGVDFDMDTLNDTGEEIKQETDRVSDDAMDNFDDEGLF